MSSTLVVGDLTFHLHRSTRRKTVGITIERDGSLHVSAPRDSSLEVIERITRDKMQWVYTKLAEREALARPRRQREFVSGEGFYYLGRSYRLLLEDTGSTTLPLRFHQGRFFLRRDEAENGREHFVQWYTVHAQSWLPGRVSNFTARLDVVPQLIKVRDLGYRWGSCSQSGSLNFHWRTILLPPPVIDYIIVHELAHLFHPNHSDNFWRHVQRVLPDADVRKQWLAENGGGYYL